MRRLLITTTVVPSSPILVTLMKEALSSSETRYLQEPKGVTSQKTPFLKNVSIQKDEIFEVHPETRVYRGSFLILLILSKEMLVGLRFYNLDGFITGSPNLTIHSPHTI
jgi:hypothetical protein